MKRFLIFLLIFSVFTPCLPVHAESSEAVQVLSIEDFYNELGSSSYIPIMPAQNIEIDGNGADFENYPLVKVVNHRNYGYTKEEYDTELSFKTAYDEEYFYFYGEVKDDHYETIASDGYWQKDSLQFAFGNLDEKFGVEYGLTLNQANNQAYFIPQNLEGIKSAVVQSGNIIKYELAVPWSAHFGKRPDLFKFCVLSNEFDGVSRKYVNMLATGIEERKINTYFPTMFFVDENVNSLCWVEGAKQIDAITDNDYNICIANFGEAFETAVKLDEADIDTKVNVPAKSYVKIPFKYRHDIVEHVMFSPKLSANSRTFDLDVNVVASYEMYKDKIAELDVRMKTLQDLIDKCEARNIPTDYEQVNLSTISLFKGYVLEDFENNDASRMAYNFECLDNLYEEAYQNLNDYLGGRKMAKSVPRYITSKVTPKGTAFYATTDNNGVIEERPVFLIGHGHSHIAYNDQNLFYNLGQSYRQGEIGPNSYLREAAPIPHWQGSKKDILKSEGDNHYIELSKSSVFSVYQCVILKPDKKYKLSFDYKGSNISNAWVTVTDWGNTRGLDTGTYDWKHFEYEFTGATSSISKIRFYLEIGSQLCIDNVEVKLAEEADDREITVENGDFEMLEPDGNFDFDFSAIAYPFHKLYEAEQNNVAVSFLLSPHYVPGFLKTKYPEAVCSTFMSIDITNEHIVEAYTYAFKTITRVLKNYKSVSDICIHNEGRYVLSNDKEHFKPYFDEQLAILYDNDLQRLNKNYGTDYKSFSEVPITNGWTQDAQSYDLRLIQNKTFVDFHRKCMEAIKSVWPDVIVNGKLQSFSNFDTSDKIGSEHHIDGIDTYAEDTMLGVHGLDGGTMWSGGDFVLDKFVGNDFVSTSLVYDYVTSISNTPILNTEDHMTADGDVTFNPYVKQHVERYTWQSAIHGRAASAAWTWNRSMSDSMVRGHLTYRPDAMAAYGKTALDSNRLSYEITALQNADRNVGIVYTQGARNYSATHTLLTRDLYSAVIFSGQRPKFILDEMPENITGRKIVFVPYAPQIPRDIMNALNEYLGNGGKVVIFGEESLKNDEYNQPYDEDFVKSITSRSDIIPVHVNDERKVDNFTAVELHNIVMNYCEEAKLNDVKLIDVQTGSPTENIEWISTEYNGKLLINVANYNYYGDYKYFKILVNGKEIHNFKDLRSGKVYDKIAEISPASPLLLEIEADGE